MRSGRFHRCENGLVTSRGYTDWSGLGLFARYAYPPNERGYCGPADSGMLGSYRFGGEIDEGLVDVACSFDGPLPYLELIARANGCSEPFSLEVMEAYWVGNGLLEAADMGDVDAGAAADVKAASGLDWPGMAKAAPGAKPHHSFHVFETYPWSDLLHTGRPEPLEILDQCRIRWGRVVDVSGNDVLVESQHLHWDGTSLSLGNPITETARLAEGDLDAIGGIETGDWLALHWAWVCDKLSPERLADLERYSGDQLILTNHRLAAGKL